MSGRRHQVMAAGFQEVAVTTARLVGNSKDMAAFEIRYEITNRTVREDEEPLPDDHVRWVVSAIRKGPLGAATISGTALVIPPDDHGRGIAYACVRLLEQLGTNTIVVDMGPAQEPPR